MRLEDGASKTVPKCISRIIVRDRRIATFSQNNTFYKGMHSNKRSTF